MAKTKRRRKEKAGESEAFQALVKYTPENAYLLGFLWADGYVYPEGKGYTVNLSIKQEDLQQIAELFNPELGWIHSCRVRKHWSPQGTVRIQNKPFHQFLIRHDYREKSKQAPSKILSWLPEGMRKHWWHGYFDGDGCLYINKKHYTYQITFSGSYEQDWSEGILMMKKLGIDSKIQNVKSEKGSFSRLRCTKKKEVMDFLNWIHQGIKFGLKRKRWPNE